MKIVLATSRKWNEFMAAELRTRLGCEVELITDPKKMTANELESIKPDYIFFPHWSDFIKAEIFNHYECVIFHMTDLPFGRGGSPLQNLIDRGLSETKISALKCEQGLDTGPIYLKKNLTLHGSAQEIFDRASKVILEMIVEIIKQKPKPVAQVGETTIFTRRKPEQSNLKSVVSVEKIYDYIRMLDAEGYPNAYLETDTAKFEFQDAKMVDGEIVATVRIKRK